MRIGLFFGSFNPIHTGHLIIANTVAESEYVDQIWFVVSPQNPFKKKNNLAHEQDRLEMVRLAIADNVKFNASDIEFHMPRPSYTVDALTYLSDKYSQHQFSLIIGEDNLSHFHKWKNFEQVLKHHLLLVYPRPEVKKSIQIDPKSFKMIEAPMIDISATFIRKSLQKEHSIRYLVPEDVIHYIKGKRLYD